MLTFKSRCVLIFHHATPIGNFIHYCSERVSLLRVRFSSLVDITYGFRLRVETGTGRPLLMYIIEGVDPK